MTEQAPVFLSLSIMTLVVVLAIFGMKYFSQMRVAKRQVDSDAAYRDLDARLRKVEKVLAEVE